MANVMSLKGLRNKPSRNGFDLSSKRNFTAKAGELLPVGTWEVLPGDSFKINLKSFTRTQPINTAAFARIREYYDFYFVPYNLLWNKANTLFTQMYDNPQHATGPTAKSSSNLIGEFPSITYAQIAEYLYTLSHPDGDAPLGRAAGEVNAAPDRNLFGYSRSACTRKLLEYLGYGDFYKVGVDSPTDYQDVNLTVNLFGLLAYQKIYSDYYRDQQWERSIPSTFNVDYWTGTTAFDKSIIDFTSEDFIRYYNMFDLRYCNWQKDLMHGLLPRQQYGDTAFVPNNLDTLKGTLDYESVQPGESRPAVFNVNLTDSQKGLSILALRQAEFLQKWKEITQSANKDYKDQIEKHWGVSASDALSERCVYLGGISSSMDINEVVNTNLTGDNAADIAGKGTGISDGNISFDSNGQYGLIMCIYHCLPLLDYTTTHVNPAFTKVYPEDYPIPEFDKVGMEAVPLVKFFNPVGSVDADISDISGFSPETILGYAPRYIDYKTGIDFSMGGFRDTLKNWVISYDDVSVASQLLSIFNGSNLDPQFGDNFESNHLGNYTLFKVNPSCLNPLFAVEVDSNLSTDQFLCSSFFDIKVVRNLDVDGLPY